MSARSQRDSTIIEVSDSGFGTPPDEHDGFVAMFRLNVPPKREATASGLGLYVVKEILDAHGGSFSMISDPGVETVFTLRFPNTLGDQTP